jgi:subtilisin
MKTASARSSESRAHTVEELTPISPAEAADIPVIAATTYERGTANTGNMLIVFPEGHDVRASLKRMASEGLKTATTSDFAKAKAFPAELGEGTDALCFEHLGACVVQGTAMGQMMLAVKKSNVEGAVIIEPERYVRAFPSEEYLRGYQEGIADLSKRVLGQPVPPADETLSATAAARPGETTATWGLQATNTLNSAYTGKGIRIAVLDTGFATLHPDFNRRGVTTKIFTGEASVEDVQGHGTHCIGTAAGPRKPQNGPRYGIAYEADIFAGKVLDNSGTGGDRGIIAGIEWAVLNKCAIISMSLGAPVYAPGYSQGFETIARRALRAGTLIIAAAGNESYRPGTVAPVGHPANCPSIVAVGALDSALRIAYFSCGGIYGGGGEVDIAGPGANIYSSWPPALSKNYHTISGTSMATPHVAGIAALFAQSDAKLRGKALWEAVVSKAKRLTLPAADVGTGLVQAP